MHECEYAVWRCRFPWSWLEISAIWRWSVWWPKSRASASHASGTPAPSWRLRPRARSTSTRWPHTLFVYIYCTLEVFTGNSQFLVTKTLPRTWVVPCPNYIQSSLVQVGSGSVVLGLCVFMSKTWVYLSRLFISSSSCLLIGGALCWGQCSFSVGHCSGGPYFGSGLSGH